MNRRNDFLDVFLRGSGPSVELLAAFFLGLIVVGVLSNWLFTVLTAGLDALRLGPLVASLLLTGTAYFLYWDDRRRTRTVEVEVDESRLAPAHAGLIWLFGPGRFDHLLFALNHHRKSGGGAHCWLVMQQIDAVQQTFGELSQQLAAAGASTCLHPVYIEQLDVQAAYQAVRSVFDREAKEEGLDPAEVIADITGGTKPLTAGMVLAAITSGKRIEYVESERDAQGNPIPQTLRVVLAGTAFYLEHGG